MNRLLIAVLTVLVFGVGYGARVWTERDRPVPPPPEAIGSEFTRPAVNPAHDEKKDRDGKDRKGEPVLNRTTLISDIEKARPKIDAYRAQLQQLDAQFDHDLMALLSPEQQKKFIQRQKRNQERRITREAREAADPTPLSDEQILRLQQVPLFNVLWSITISARLERIHRDLKLEPEQQARVHELLLARRDRFLALVDSSPPPTVSLSELATRTRKIADAPAK